MRRLLPTVCIALALCGCGKPLSDRLAALEMRPAEVSPTRLVLTSPRYRIVLHRDSSVAMVNGVPVQLPAPATCDKGRNWDLPENALRRVLMPLLDSSPHPIRVILVDPGHGGHDRGSAAANGTTEKELNLALAQELASALRAAGFVVHMTRENDVFIPLDRRASAAPADLFISVHHNSAANTAASGMETFVLRAETPSEQTGTGAALHLAFLIQKERGRVPGLPDRGVRFARFKVLRLATPTPAVLIEAGFLSNPVEAARCADREHRRLLAAAIARAVVSWRDGGR